MASTYPTTIDAFTNPIAGDLLTSPSHATQHADINDAMEAVQTKLAIGNTVIGTYTAYTPTITNVVLGNATITSNYCRVNNLVHYYGVITFGSTTTVTTTNWNLSLPINTTLLTGNNPFGELSYVDVSAGSFTVGNALTVGLSGFARLRVFNASVTYLQTNELTALVPFTWATGDRIDWNFTYQAA